MDEAEDVEDVGTELVDEAVVVDQELARDLVTELGDDAPEAREVSEGFSGRADPLDESFGVGRRVPCDVVGGLFEVVSGGLGPDQSSSHLAIRRTTSS